MPTTPTIVIRNARLINEGAAIDADLLLKSGRIDTIGNVGTVATPPGASEFDCAGRLLLPGMIDDQVHFREPGFEHKGDIATESHAAVAGGITSYMEMPNCNPLTISNSALADKHQRAAERSLANYGFYLGATNDNLEDVKGVDVHLTCGVKVFMGASTGNMLVDDERTLEGIFASCPLLIATHCEDTPTILANEALAEARYGTQIPFTEHPKIRSEEACFKSSSLAVSLARRHGARLHVLHLTTARELELFDAGPLDAKHITVEACVHHLFFDESWYPSKGADIKCNPAIKTAADRIALLRAITEDRIDVIATDHAPHTREEKDRPYAAAPAGLPLVQHALLTLMEHVAAGTLSVEQVAQKTAHAPATLFAVKQRGFIREGYWADLVVIDPNGRTDVDRQPILSKCGWSPFSGMTFRSSIDATFVNGVLAYQAGGLETDQPGRPLEYQRD